MILQTLFYLTMCTFLNLWNTVNVDECITPVYLRCTIPLVISIQQTLYVLSYKLKSLNVQTVDNVTVWCPGIYIWMKQHISPHLSSSGSVAYKAEVHLLQFAMSAATRPASFQLFHPSMRLSFSIVDRHFVFGRPTFLLPSGVQVNAVSHLLFLFIRRICPTHFHLLNLTSVLIV